jgi:hypothetical protein
MAAKRNRAKYGDTPEEAEVLARIIDLKVQGISAANTADELNADSVVPPRGDEWTRSKVAKFFERDDIKARIEEAEKQWMEENLPPIPKPKEPPRAPTWDEMEEEELQKFGCVTYSAPYLDADSGEWEEKIVNLTREEIEKSDQDRAARILLEQKERGNAIGSLRFHRFGRLSPQERVYPRSWKDAPNLLGQTIKPEGEAANDLLDGIMGGDTVQKWWKQAMRRAVTNLLDEIYASRKEILALKQEVEQLKLLKREG